MYIKLKQVNVIFAGLFVFEPIPKAAVNMRE